MPRLTNNDYEAIHQQLRHYWLHDQRPFSRLAHAQQHAIFDFFVPHKDMGNSELLHHRQGITKKRPSLPAQAGKACHRLMHGPAIPHTVYHAGTQAITVRSVVNPELTAEALLPLMLTVVEEMQSDAPQPPPGIDTLGRDVENHAA